MYDQNEDTFKLFNVIVSDLDTTEPILDHVQDGFIIDFVPTGEQLAFLKEQCKGLELRTLFTVEERTNSNPVDLVKKQILHYIETYGLGMDGTLTVPLTNEKVVNVRYIRGVTEKELEKMALDLCYANAPVADAKLLVRVVQGFAFDYELDKVQNNEVRMLLFDLYKDKFSNGDDVVRWLCWQATESPLLIKSPQVICQLNKWALDKGQLLYRFLERHQDVLAEVFNRHKRLILAMKQRDSKSNSLINRISRMSKKRHVPIREPINKRLIGLALDDKSFNIQEALGKATVRDKFKYLNLLLYRKAGTKLETYVIRNGKVHFKEVDRQYTPADIWRVEQAVLRSLREDLIRLEGKKILLDPRVDYGLPISRKQCLGRLPYGTQVSIGGLSPISSGIYWQNDGGARDLDLSAVSLDGSRIGWGQASGYVNNEIIFSGDVTDAHKGAMEFMTSSNRSYGLLVNIFSGQPGSKMELVVGHGPKDISKQWIDDCVIRENHSLDSRECFIGFVRGNSFIVYAGRLNMSRASFATDRGQAMVSRAYGGLQTVGNVLNGCEIGYSVDPDDYEEWDFDLRYDRFSYDTLEKLLLTNDVP